MTYSSERATHQGAVQEEEERERIPSDRLPFSRALWFVGFVALLTQPWCDTTGCNGGTRRQTGIDLATDDALLVPIMLFAFAMVAPMIGRFLASRTVRPVIEAFAFTAALLAVPLVLVIPRVEILGKRVPFFAADAAFVLVLIGFLDALARMIGNLSHRRRPPVRAIEPGPEPSSPA